MFESILGAAIPLLCNTVSSIITDGNTSPIKSENPYVNMASDSIRTIARSLAEEEAAASTIKADNSKDITPYEVAKNKKYKYNF